MSETCRKLVGNLSETLKERKEQDALNGMLGDDGNQRINGVDLIMVYRKRLTKIPFTTIICFSRIFFTFAET